MRIALLSDVHSNIVALEAVMNAILRHHPDRILSLGDQVNLGPCPRETLALLKSHNVLCLHGNHERYILGAMAGDPGYAGANFHSLRFNAQRLTPEEITFPKDITIGNVIFTHAMPGDDRFPIFNPEAALPKLREMHFDHPTHIICGHGHNPTYYALKNLTIHSIGSVGCMDEGAPGTAPYAIADIDEDGFSLRPFTVAYDASLLRPLFRSSGMTDCCPIMARIALTQMTYNCEIIVDFVVRASALSRERGEAQISQQTWEDADRLYPWADGLTTQMFWATS